MAAITSGFFFREWPPAAGAAHPLTLDVGGEQLLASARHGTGVDAEQRCDAPVAAPAALERFEPGVQAALTFIEQAGEQHDGGAQFVGHEVGIRYRSGQPGGGQQSAPGAQLLRRAGAVGGAVQEAAGKAVTGQLAVPHERTQGILSADVQPVVQLLAELSGRRIGDHRRGGCQQRAGAGEPYVAERPQPVLIEVDELRQGVVAAPMGVAGAAGQFLELAKGGASGAGAERGHEVRQGGDGLLMEQVDDRGGRVLRCPHCGTITNVMIVMVP